MRFHGARSSSLDGDRIMTQIGGNIALRLHNRGEKQGQLYLYTSTEYPRNMNDVILFRMTHPELEGSAEFLFKQTLYKRYACANLVLQAQGEY
jgi:hypothetical protein